MIYLGKFKRTFEENELEIPKNQLEIGINNLKNHLIKIMEETKVEYLIDKPVTTQEGLVTKGSYAVCPINGWKLDLEPLTYNDLDQTDNFRYS